MAVSPQTYHGYDSEGNCVSSATASSALDYIDPVAISNAVDKVSTVATDEMKQITTQLSKIKDDSNDAVIVQGTRMTSTFEDVITGINTIPGQIGDSLAELKTLAQQEHDNLQTQFNESARKACYCNGAVTVS